MDTNAIRLSTRAIPGVPDPRVVEPPVGGDFKASLAGMIGQVQSLQEQAARAGERLISGEVEDVHQVMIAAEEASVAFEMMMEIRNKLLEAYQDIMRMQV
jgi:flagellar hook-basal body complex protein FliE